MTATLSSKFESHMDTIHEAIAGEVDLRTHRKLYNKLYRFYKKAGVQFTGDHVVDYNIIINYLYDDIYVNY